MFASIKLWSNLRWRMFTNAQARHIKHCVAYLVIL